MGYDIWSGMLILTVVILCSNIRIIMLANQISPILLITLLIGIISYYFVYSSFCTLFYLECKNVITHQIRSLPFWTLVYFLAIFRFLYRYLLYKHSNQFVLKFIIIINHLKKENLRYNKFQLKHKLILLLMINNNL
jgi:hypothetical protein